MTYVKGRAVAEEVVQETWLAVIEGLDRFEGRSSLKTWIFSILVNKAKTRGVREARSVPFTALAPEDDEPAVPRERFRDRERRVPRPLARRIRPTGSASAETAVHGPRDAAGASMRAIAELPLAQQTVIRMRDVEGYSPTRSARRSTSPRATSACFCIARARACAPRSRGTSMTESHEHICLPGVRRARDGLPRGRRCPASDAALFEQHLELLRRLRAGTSTSCARRSRRVGRIAEHDVPEPMRDRLLAAFRDRERA